MSSIGIQFWHLQVLDPTDKLIVSVFLINWLHRSPQPPPGFHYLVPATQRTQENSSSSCFILNDIENGQCEETHSVGCGGRGKFPSPLSNTTLQKPLWVQLPEFLWRFHCLCMVVNRKVEVDSCSLCTAILSPGHWAGPFLNKKDCYSVDLECSPKGLCIESYDILLDKKVGDNSFLESGKWVF